jgi:hypothetical protein
MPDVVVSDCVTLDEDKVRLVDKLESRNGRRGFLMAASALVAGVATVLNGGVAKADCQGSVCCQLARCNICAYTVSKDRWNCPSGWYRTIWTCRSSTGRLYICGECSRTTSCWYGPWLCSTWYAA